MKRFLTISVLALGVAGLAVGVGLASTARKAATAYEAMIIVGHTLGQKGTDGLTHDTTYGANFSVAKGLKRLIWCRSGITSRFKKSQRTSEAL